MITSEWDRGAKEKVGGPTWTRTPSLTKNANHEKSELVKAFIFTCLQNRRPAIIPQESPKKPLKVQPK
jgi:hypothetical protein